MAHLLQDGLECGPEGQRNVKKLRLPGFDAVAIGKLVKIRGRVIVLRRMPDVLDPLDDRVRGAVVLGAQVVDVAHVCPQPFLGLGVLGDIDERAAAVHAAGRDGAAEYGARVTQVGHRIRGDKGLSFDDELKRFFRDDGSHVGGRELFGDGVG